MPVDLTADYWTRQRFDRTETSLPDVVTGAGGLYGMSPTGYLSAIARVDGFAREDLDHAVEVDRTLVRVRAMRNSLYLLPTGMVPWVTAALRERNARSIRSLVDKALDGATQEVWAERIEALLDAEELAAAEIRRRLAPTDPAVAENLKYLIARLAADGRIVRARKTGGWRSDRFTYALWDRWVGGGVAPDPAEARTRLARWYFAAFGPATIEDFRWWSGLTVAATRAAVAAAEPDEVETAHGPMLALGPPGGAPPPASAVRLLPVWDTAMIGHADRSRVIDPARAAWAYDRLGNATSVLLVAGRAAGVWQLVGDDELVARVALFGDVSTQVWENIEGEAERIRTALAAASVQVVRCPLPGPLQSAPRNRFLSPLRDC